MVFSSVPLYPDPTNWNQQRSSNVVVDEEDDVHQLPHPGATSMAALPPQVAAGGGASQAGAGGSMAERARMAKIPQAEAVLKCPRCDSTNTKFCYFNNYSLTQPRHFCKTCRRYWTRGGALRSVPVGGGCRRNKRGNKPSSSKSSTQAAVNSAVSSSSSSAVVFRATPPPFLAPWHHVPDYGFGGIQQPIDMTTPERMGLEQWRIQQMQQLPFLGMTEPSLPTTAMFPGLYPFEGELVGGSGKSMSTVKMEDRSQVAAATATAANLPRQFFNMGRNDGQIWPANGDGGNGEDHGGRWISHGEQIFGFNSSSSGNLL